MGIIFLAMVMMFSAPPALAADSGGSVTQAEHQAIVCVRTADGGASLQAQGADGLSWEPLMDVSGTTTGGVLTTQGADQTEIMLVKSDTLTTEEIIAAAKARGDVLSAEPDYIYTPDQEEGQTADTSQIVNTSSTDYSRYQWGLKNTGLFTKGTAGVDIGNTGGLTGSRDTVVAVMDSGIDCTQEELADQMVNLLAYPSLVSSTMCSQYGYNAVEGEWPNDPYDYANLTTHGTHCAGIIAAAANGTGTNGVMKNVSLMAVRIQGKTTINMKESDIVRGFSWLYTAKQAGVNVKVVNASFGSSLLKYATELAIQKDGEAGILTVMASGNSSLDIDKNGSSGQGNPVTSAYKVTVDSMDAQGQASDFSNYGVRSTDVFAPGSDILSTVGGFCAKFNAFTAALDPSRILTYNGFEDKGGTSATEQDVNPLTFCEYDDAAADHCGAELTASSATAFIGDKSISVARPASGNTVTLITKPMKLTPDTSRKLYISGSLHSDNTKKILDYDNLSLDYRKADGSFTGNGTSQDLRSRQASWSTDYAIVPADGSVDFDHFQVRITVHFTDQYAKSIAIDSFGMGYGLEKYAVYSGTSMATPMVAGEAGLLASLYPDENAAQISARITGGTTDDAELANLCKSGGYVNVAKAASDPNPAVQKITTDGQTAVLSGYFFGSPGSVTVGGQKAAITHWSDTEITVTIPAGLTDVQEFVVTDSTGQHGRNDADVGNSMSYTDLPLPTGGEYAAAGTSKAAAVGKDVYLLLTEWGGDMRELWQFDTTTAAWKNMGTAITLKDGETVPMRSMMYVTSFKGNLYVGSVGNFYKYDPGDGKWTSVKLSESICSFGCLVEANGQLLSFGGVNAKGAESADIQSIDLDTGAVSDAGQMPITLMYTQVAFSDGTFMICGGSNRETGNNYKTYMTTDLKHYTEGDTLPGDDGQQMFMSLAVAPTKTGLIMAGMVHQADGVWQDTWNFDKSTGKWTASDKVLSAAKTFNTVGCQANGRFYVWGVSSITDKLTLFRSTDIESPAAGPSVTYQVHGRNYGWDQGWKTDGETAGTTGQALRLEALKAKIVDADGKAVDGLGITYQVHVKNTGWMDWKSDGQIAGTTGQSLRMEAVKIKLTGDKASQYSVSYRVHVQNKGWTDWVKDGAEAGTTGLSLRAEAIEIKLTAK